MTPIDPIPEQVVPVSGSGKTLPSKGRISLPIRGQDVPHGTPENTEATPAASETLRQTVDKLNAFAGKMERDLHFRIDEVADRTVITVVNPETKEIIRQIPSDEVLALAHHLERDMSAILHTVG